MAWSSTTEFDISTSNSRSPTNQLGKAPATPTEVKNKAAERGVNGQAEVGLDFLGDMQLVKAALRRLFGEILPYHSSLAGMIKFRKSPSENIELFASAFPSSPSRPLHFFHVEDTVLQPSCIGQIVGTIRRNSRIQCLDLKRCGLYRGACKLVCDSAVENERLRMLAISGELGADTFVQALKRSELRELHATANWTVEAFVALIECLRTNVVLEHLVIVARDAFPTSTSFDLLENLLTSYNIKLQEVQICQGSDLADHLRQEWVLVLLWRNKSLTAVNARLQKHHYRVATISCRRP
jgi:hypothetical protein